MKTRINIAELQPAAYKAMFALESYVASTALTKTEKELIKVRASQINGCAFCLDMHTRDALQYGETSQRLFLLNAWRETELFTPSERALLALTEEMTLIQNGVSQATYDAALEAFGSEKLAQLMVAVMAINAWNRMAIATQLPVGS